MGKEVKVIQQRRARASANDDGDATVIALFTY